MSEAGEEPKEVEGEEGEVEEKSIEFPEEPEDPNEPEPKQDPAIERNWVHSIIKAGLSQIAKTHNGAGYAFATLNIQGKGIKTLFNILTTYPHLRTINVSQNQIDDIETVNSIPYLLSLDASSNLIPNLNSFNHQNTLEFLQVLNLSKNKLTKFSAIKLPKLRKLTLDENMIDSCEGFTGHPNLEILEIKKNKLKNCDGLTGMFSLTELYLSENQITDFNGLKYVPALKKIYLGQNRVKKFTTPLANLPSIYHIGLEENRILDVKEVGKLKELETLKSLNLLGQVAPEEGEEEAGAEPAGPGGDLDKKEVIMLLPHLTIINEEEVTPEEKEDALNELKERIAAEEERKREEEERRKEEEERRREEEEERKRQEEEERKKQEEEEEERRRQEEEAKKANVGEGEVEGEEDA